MRRAMNYEMNSTLQSREEVRYTVIPRRIAEEL
jgi:hypothetical protein